MRVFASETLKKVMGRFGIPEDEPIESAMITKSLETAQERIEGFNFDSRKQVLAYDDVMNTQRLAIYARRRSAHIGGNEEVEELVLTLIGDGSSAFDMKKDELGDFIPLCADCFCNCRYVLAGTSETMDYLRVSILRAHGQRDPLIEYRRGTLLLGPA